MRNLLVVVLLLLCAAALFAQAAPSQPAATQSLRDAIVEFITATDAKTFLAHTPDSFQAAMAVPEAQENLRAILEKNLISKHVDRIEKGSGDDPLVTIYKENSVFRVLLLGTDQEKDETTFTVVVRRFDDGKEMIKWDWPKFFIGHARLENGTWRLVELEPYDGVSERHFDVNDSRLMAQLTKSRKTLQEEGAISAIRNLIGAEYLYAQKYPKVGATCRLADMGPTSRAQEDEHHAALISDDEALGGSDGYRIAITGCSPTAPSKTYVITAVPSWNHEAGVRAFCADQDRQIYYADDGTAATCLKKQAKLP